MPSASARTRDASAPPRAAWHWGDPPSRLYPGLPLAPSFFWGTLRHVAQSAITRDRSPSVMARPIGASAAPSGALGCAPTDVLCGLPPSHVLVAVRGAGPLTGSVARRGYPLKAGQLGVGQVR